MRKEEKLIEGLKANKSKTYIIPLLYKYIKFPVHNIVNSFVRHEDYLDKTKHLFIVFKWTPNIEDTKLEDGMINNELCELHEDLNNKFYIMCFRIPDDILDEYNKFIEGKYSKLSDDSKKSIISFYRLNKDHAVCKVLTKDQEYKKQLEESLGGVRIDNDAELSDVIYIDRETFKNNLIEKKQRLLKPMSRY